MGDCPIVHSLFQKEIQADGMFRQMGCSGRWEIQADDGIFRQKGYSGRRDIQGDGIFREIGYSGRRWEGKRGLS